MPFLLSPVLAPDAEMIIRKVDYPAHQDTPLYRIMFPCSNTSKQEEQLEEEIRWMVDGIIDTINNQSSNLLKVCTEDGTPVGVVKWVMGQTTATHNGGKQSTKMEDSAGNDQVKRAGVLSTSGRWHPGTLDLDAWLDVSSKLRKERESVLQSHDDSNICRKFGYFILFYT
jgi:hypothetical protein